MAPRILLPISDGFEEIEAMTIIDILRRANASITVAGLTKGMVTGRSNVSIQPDTTLDEALTESPYDMVVLPGGLPNAYTLRDDPRIKKLLQDTKEKNGYLAAICAAPAALQEAGVLEGHKATNYPGVKSDLPEEIYSEDSVVESGNVITSRGPGTAMEFSLTLVKILFGEKTATQIAQDVLAKE